MELIQAVTRVRDVLEVLTRWQPQLLSDPETGELVVRGPVALDPRELGDGGGGIVLAAGVADAGAAAFVTRSRALGAVLVIVRADDLEPGGLRIPTDASCALISLGCPGAWREVDAAIDVLLRSNGAAPLPGLSFSATGDLFALANAVAAAVGGATTVEDADMRVLAYSNWPHHATDELRRRVILDRQVPKDASPEQYRQLMRDHGVLRVHGPGEFPRIAVAVRAAGRVLGFLWVLEPEPFDQSQLDALARAGEVAAAHLLKFFEINSPDREYRADAVRRVLDGRATSRDFELLRLAARTSVTVAAFRCLVRPEASTEVVTNRLADLAGVYLADAGGMAGIAVADDTVHVLLRAATDPHRLVPMIERFVKQVEAALDVKVYAGIGRRVQEPRDVPLSTREADLVVGTLSREICNQSVARLGDVLDQAVVYEFLDLLAEHPELQHPGVKALVDRDARKASGLAPTLLAFLHANGDYQAVADDLKVHVNTVRYRVEKACQQSGLDLGDALQRFVAWVQLISLLRQQSSAPEVPATAAETTATAPARR